MSQRYVFTPPTVVSVPVVGTDEQLPIHRIYCVGRNYAEHAKEMGFSGREDPFFFIKPADTLVVAAEQAPATIDYPSLTQNLHHEVELVVAIGRAGRDIPASEAHHHIFGYAVGLDMTRRDLQNEMKKQGRPWCIGKSHEQSAPVGWITPASNMGAMESAARILKPGGRIVVLDLLKHQFEKARDLYADVWLGFSESDLHEMLGKAGFKGIETSVVHRESNSPHFQTLLALAEKENRFTSTGHWSGS
jgi:fumarylpyruvate hydrolase